MKNNVVNFLKNKECSDMFKKYGIIKVDLFWSYARWEQTKNSDIDILIENNQLIHKLTFRDILKIEKYLKNKLWVPSVDIWTRKSFNKHMLPYIEKELLQII